MRLMRSKFLNQNDVKLISYSGFAENKQVEYIVISESNFLSLKQISKVFIEVEKQVYEDIPGFESLRIVFKNKVQCTLSFFFLNLIFPSIFYFYILCDPFMLKVIQFEL